MKRILVSALAALSLACALPKAGAQTGFVTMTGANLTDATGAPISNATACFQLTNLAGTPIGVHVGGSGTGQAAPRQACGPVNNGALVGTWQLSDPTAAGTNLVPDPVIVSGFSTWSNPGSGWSIQVGGGLATGQNAFVVAPGASGFSESAAIAVVPGQTYTLSCSMYAVHVTAGSPGCQVLTSSGAGLANAFGIAGQATYPEAQFTVPAGITQVYFSFNLNGATIAASQTLVMAAPLLQAGSSRVVDANLSNPQEPCELLTVTDNTSGNVALGGPGSGYSCLQPQYTESSPMTCAAGLCNLDTYVPTGTPGVTQTTGPTGATGAPGMACPLATGTVSVGGLAASITGTCPSQQLNITVPTGSATASGPVGAIQVAGPSGAITNSLVPIGLYPLRATSTALYLMDDGTGSSTLADSSTNSNTITLPGSGGPTRVQGALDFVGSECVNTGIAQNATGSVIILVNNAAASSVYNSATSFELPVILGGNGAASDFVTLYNNSTPFMGYYNGTTLSDGAWTMAPLSGWHVLAFTGLGSTPHLYIDGVETASYQNQSAVTVPSGVNWQIGCFNGVGTPGFMASPGSAHEQIGALDFQPGTLTAQQVQAATNWLLQSEAPYNKQIPFAAGQETLNASNVLVMVGDSRVAGVPGTSGGPVALLPTLNSVHGAAWSTSYISEAGGAGQGIMGQLATLKQTYGVGNITRAAIYWSGVNGYINQWDCAAIKAIADIGYDVFVVTEPSESTDTSRDAYNVVTYANYKSCGAKALVDIAEIPAIGTDGASTTGSWATYFASSGGPHFTTAGYQLVANAITKVVNAYYANTEAGWTNYAPTSNAGFNLTTPNSYIDVSADVNGEADAVLPECQGLNGLPYNVHIFYSSTTQPDWDPWIGSLSTTNSELIDGQLSLLIFRGQTVTLLPTNNPPATGGCHWQIQGGNPQAEIVQDERAASNSTTYVNSPHFGQTGHYWAGGHDNITTCVFQNIPVGATGVQKYTGCNPWFTVPVYLGGYDAQHLLPNGSIILQKCATGVTVTAAAATTAVTIASFTITGAVNITATNSTGATLLKGGYYITKATGIATVNWQGTAAGTETFDVSCTLE
jgi:hypothetical protein